MKYLITGGNGFIGSNIVDSLVNLNHEVIVIDNLSSDAHDQFYYNQKASYYECDVNDYVMCSDVFKKSKPDYVLHLAAEARIQNCINDPRKAYETNLLGTLTMLDLCVKYSVKKLVLSSTSAIYGSRFSFVPGVPLNEQMLPDCLNSYSLSKFNAEQACKMYSSLYNQDTVCLRYFNVYGPRQPKRGSYAPVIGIFSRQIKNNEPMTIVGDGSQTRDYVHVYDVINANIQACLYEDKLNGEVFNVGSGKKYSVLELAKMMGNNYIHIPERIGESKHTLANISKIKKYFNWEPKYELLQYMKDKEYDN